MTRAPLLIPLAALAFLTAASAPEAPRPDPIAALKARLEKGLDHLKFEDNAFGYLKDLLAHLGVNPDSQMLVYSKTSFQSDLIGPDKPRSVFFNDTVAVYSEDGQRRPGAANTQNLMSLADKFDTRTYLSPHADIVALMTFEHQARMTNMLLGAGAAARRGGFPRTQLEDLLAYMLFVDEAPFPAPVAGTSGFTQSFPAKAPRDAKGRALRDFDLTTRLFKYPLSYMIYSASFDALPADARTEIYTALYAILTGADTSPRFARLTRDDRKAILEILQTTKSDLPPAWKKAAL